MPAPIIPWEPCLIPSEIISEFERRKKNRSLRYVDNSDLGNWDKYRGPMSPWVRLCSNSKGNPDVKKEGFVLYGGKGFYSDYGFTRDKNNPSIIGYVPSKGINPHTIDNDLSADYPIHVPAPEIERIQINIQKELFRRASVEWVCFSKKQLEYMTPYFLVPGISCIMEWGWNIYDPTSLVDLTNIGKLEKLFNNPYPLYTENIIKSKGNYDVIFGIITNFEWSADGNKFHCKTEITSKDRIYSGLIVDSTTMDKSSVDENSQTTSKPFDSLIQFIDTSLDQLKSISTTKPEDIPQLKEFVNYVRTTHKKKGNSDEYLYGVFFGRDPEDKNNKFQNKPDTDKDFDYKGKNSELWLNLGLVIDAINFHAQLPGANGKEMFRIDVDDVVIGAHPNMISSDGGVCIIPNFESPHYFFGKYGSRSAGTAGFLSEDFFLKLKPCDDARKVPITLGEARKAQKMADFRLQDICGSGGTAYRDDIDLIVNSIRYENGTAIGSCAFPFRDPHTTIRNNYYPPHYSGYLRHIYVNLSFLKDLLKSSSDITTYYKLVEKILEGINDACGGFWDLRLVSGTGDITVDVNEPAPMKIVDYKFMSFSNRGKVWSFDYFDADSLLLGIGFKPTLSNAQAIRTIYTSTNNPENKTVITNGNDELLDYKFEDRLNIGKNVGSEPISNADQSGFENTMRNLQQISPCGGSYQITTDNKIRRLVMPAPDIQQLLLADGDEENNPKYTGIMPGIQATFTIQGIGGLRTFMMFLCRGLPRPYSEKNIIFRIIDIQETIESGKWTTQITAGVIPLRANIKARLGIP